MKSSFFLIVCAIVLFGSPVWAQSGASLGSVEKSKQELLDLENHWLLVEDDPKALESILAPDFLHVLAVGIITRDEQLDYVRKHPSQQPATKKHFEDMHVRVYGSVGIVNGMVVAEEAQGVRRTLFTDVFAYRDGKWMAVSAQELPINNSQH